MPNTTYYPVQLVLAKIYVKPHLAPLLLLRSTYCTAHRQTTLLQTKKADAHLDQANGTKVFSQLNLSNVLRQVGDKDGVGHFLRRSYKTRATGSPHLALLKQQVPRNDVTRALPRLSGTPVKNRARCPHFRNNSGTSSMPLITGR